MKNMSKCSECGRELRVFSRAGIEKEQEEMRLVEKTRHLTEGLESLLQEFVLYPKVNVESLKGVKPRNTITRYIFRGFQGSHEV